jgi:hypothetical protein
MLDALMTMYLYAKRRDILMALQVALALQGPGYQTLGLVVSHTGKKHRPHFQALFLVAWICIKLPDSSNVRIVT